MPKSHEIGEEIEHVGHKNRTVAILVSVLAFFLASYTGVLLSVTNRPIWADTNLLGLLFLLSGASTAAALMILLAGSRSPGEAAIRDDAPIFFSMFCIEPRLLVP